MGHIGHTGHTDQQGQPRRRRKRARGVGGSDAARIMAGDWLTLWEEKTGRREKEDLSDVLQVQIGIVTEELNRRWFARRTGTEVITEGCEGLVHRDYPFMHGNLDGWVPGGILECKHVSAFAKDEEIVERYYPQVQHYLAVTETSVAYLSVIFGNHRWRYFEVEADDAYQERLIGWEAAFWRHVESDTPPVDRDAQRVAVAFDDLREADMEGNNLWASYAAQWLETKAAAAIFQTATKGLKSLVEDDVKLAAGHGVKVTRSRAGALTVREAA